MKIVAITFILVQGGLVICFATLVAKLFDGLLLFPGISSVFALPFLVGGLLSTLALVIIWSPV